MLKDCAAIWIGAAAWYAVPPAELRPFDMGQILLVAAVFGCAVGFVFCVSYYRQNRPN